MPKKFSPEKMARLRSEAENPYRALRQFIYLGCAASGFIGGVVFFAQITAGRDLAQAVPNFALQAGVVAGMIFLWRWENQRKLAKRKSNK